MANSDDNDSQLDDEEPDPNDKQPPMINIEGKWRKWLKIVDKEGHVCKIWLKKILSISESLIGQRLIVWEGVIDSDIPGAEAVTIRNSWINSLRKYIKGMIFHILAQNDVEDVSMLLTKQQVKIQHHTMETNLSTHFIQPRLYHIHSLDNHLQVLACLITHSIGILIVNFSSLGELLFAFLDYIINEWTNRIILTIFDQNLAHKDTVKLTQTMISGLVNLLLTMIKAKNWTTHEKYIQCYISGQAQMDLCEWISYLTQWDVLADWSYAILIHTHILTIRGYLNISQLKTAELHHNDIAGIMEKA